ncbi:hypothetical protein PPACK8108_LOCUS21623 [Phakopsora pachyrhizi]|uniref:Nitrogen regulatory protein areA GATA-like domain-containing protein n=1 Tax=Phakopsora pachyrhizi TaxID=170000 RepID=A0AAV0BKN4_PHAPC|nr:hypothetical protein PPACK8108_LOCUS21623 [Phakopsora pachyrhizi]
MGVIAYVTSLSAPTISITSPCSSGSNSSTPTPTCTVVPQYPYNVSMPPFAGALLPYERSPMPDDNDVQTRLPSRCVDYLSHDWDESDVWTSWKAMTRHKNELANGVRLENASWRTWAKQRSNLKTISPETLNWLKDSDVTWLYGPLHTAVDPVPLPRASTLQDRFNLDDLPSQHPNMLPSDSLPGSSVNSRPGSSASVRSAKMPGKPILKHRSLSEILGVPNLSSQSPGDCDGPSESDGELINTAINEQRPRVAVAHTVSDSKLVNRDHHDVGRGTPPTFSCESSDSTTSGDDSDVSHHYPRACSPPLVPGRKTAMRTTGTSKGGLEDNVKPKKHISFSHRVEQCIAVDSEEERTTYITTSSLKGSNGRTLAPTSCKANLDEEDDDDDDDDDDLLTFRSSAPRQPGLHAVSSRYSTHFGSSQSLNDLGSTTTSALSFPSEPSTIARMAPTTLKSSEVLPAPSPVVVYDQGPVWDGTQDQVPTPSYSSYTVTSTPSPSIAIVYDSTLSCQARSVVNSTLRSDPPSYPSHTYGPVTSSKLSSTSGTSSPAEERPLGSSRFGSSSSINKWGTPDDDDDTEEFTAMGFDYFSGPDLGLGEECEMSKGQLCQLGSFQDGLGTSESYGLPNNEDNTLSRSVFKPDVPFHAIESPVRSIAGGSSSRFGFQETILVPQVKSHSYKSSENTSSSSLSSGSLSQPRDSLSSSTANNHPDDISTSSADLHSSTSSSSSTLGKFTSSPSSNSRLLPKASLSTNFSAGSSRLSLRPGGMGTRANSHDGSRSFVESSCVINATIGEETEGDYEETLPDASTTSYSNAIQEPKSPILSFSKKGIESHRSSRTHSHCPQSSQRPDLISSPKLASAHLDSTQGVARETSSSTIERCIDVEATYPTGGRSEPSSPTVMSLLSKQNGSPGSVCSYRWSDERLLATSYHGSKSDKSVLSRSRPSLRPRGSIDSNSSNYQIRQSAENERNTLRPGRISKSMDVMRRLSGDEFGFVNYYGDLMGEEDEIGQDDAEVESAGVISRAAEIVGTARDIVGAIWSVGSRSIWGGGDVIESSELERTDDDKKMKVLRRASTGGLHAQIEDPAKDRNNH